MKIKIILSVIALFITQFIVAQPVVRTVDNRPESGAQFTSVQAAINASSTTVQDIIYIHPSPTSYGSITVDRSITLVGPGHNPANSNGLRATLTTITISADTADSVFTGLNFNTLSAYSFGSNSANIHIINNRITNTVDAFHNGTSSEDWVIEGNYFNTGYTTTNIDANNSASWRIRNNYISGQVTDIDQTSVVTNNLFVNEDTTGTALIFTSLDGIASPIVTNNIFIFTDPDITELINSGTPVVYTNCLTFKAGGGAALVALPGSGNLDNIDPEFTSIPTLMDDFYNNDYTLLGSSPAINTATDGGQIGVFGRNFPFDINGRPHSMSYPESMTILNTVVQPGQNLNVQFQATQKN